MGHDRRLISRIGRARTVTGSDGREGWAAVWLEWSRNGGRSARALYSKGGAVPERTAHGMGARARAMHSRDSERHAHHAQSRDAVAVDSQGRPALGVLAGVSTAARLMRPDRCTRPIMFRISGPARAGHEVDLSRTRSSARRGP